MERRVRPTSEEEDEDLLRLSLCTGSIRQPQSPPTTPSSASMDVPIPIPVPVTSMIPQQCVSVPIDVVWSPYHQQSYHHPHIFSAPPALYNPPSFASSSSVPFPPVQDLPATYRTGRLRKSPTQSLKEGKTGTITPPYPWATSKRCKVHTYQYLMTNGLKVISGEVQCKRCEKNYEMEYDLEEKFLHMAKFIEMNKYQMHDRAPNFWMNPSLPDCRFCDQQNCVKPILKKKREINWLFLLLGQMIGCCKLSELKYFCKHTENHRTAAKDRLVYLTYLDLCRQLNPKGLFDI